MNQEPPAQANHSERLLRLEEVESRSGLKRSSIYTKAGAGEFPAPLKLSRRCTRWKSSEVDAWVSAQDKRGVES
ncbi:MAG: transcriptional regulator [Betaproteobacteria bacterium HGW-Betaproteobacteria-15]|nr:MAG: transcriptional regulator [Betaproteobacteria bacterium HGW-Betaproteobacteria-15]